MDSMGIDIFNFFALDRANFPRKLIGSASGELLIVGSGRCLWDDTRGLPISSTTMCVNDTGMYWPGRITHWYSNDIEQLPHWVKGRRRRLVQLYGGPNKLHSCFERSLPECQNVNHWPFPGQGSSGLLAIFVALALGYDNITVAGIPFDNSGHFYDPPQSHTLGQGRPWSNFETEAPDRIIQRSLPLLVGKVRAISGRLKVALENE